MKKRHDLPDDPPFMKHHNERGAEILDTTPLEIPLGWSRPPTMEEMVRRIVSGHLQMEEDLKGHESFEEADDFDVGDSDGEELPTSSAHTLTMEQEAPAHEFADRVLGPEPKQGKAGNGRDRGEGSGKDDSGPGCGDDVGVGEGDKGKATR